MRVSGIFSKSFLSFGAGLAGLKEISYSAEQSLGGAMSPTEVMKTLEENEGTHTFHWNGWEYITVGGLMYGYRNLVGAKHMFFLRHPDGVWAPEQSSLAQAALAAGWEELVPPQGWWPDEETEEGEAELRKLLCIHHRSPSQVIWLQRHQLNNVQLGYAEELPRIILENEAIHDRLKEIEQQLPSDMTWGVLAYTSERDIPYEVMSMFR